MSYVRELADAIRREVPPELIPPNSDDLFLTYAALALALGQHIDERNVHDAWVAWMESRGASHESMVPFSDLPTAVRDEDRAFMLAIHRAVARPDSPK